MSKTLALFLWSLVTAAGLQHAYAAVPDISGQWGRDMLFFESPPSGSGPVMRAERKADGTLVPATPCCAIVQSWFGDPNNSVLKPAAAQAVRTNGELALQGKVLPDLHTLCRPEPPPFVLGLHYGVLIIQQMDEVKLLYLLYNTVRHVRLNAAHPRSVMPSWSGDSVAHYEGDTLVVDTTGIKVAPFSTVDGFGTPHSEALHVVERYRLIAGDAAARAQGENGGKPTPTPTFGRGIIDPDTAKPGLQVDFTVEDANVFMTPWSGRVTYRPVIGIWPEAVCQENPHEYYSGRDTAIPEATTADF